MYRILNIGIAKSFSRWVGGDKNVPEIFGGGGGGSIYTYLDWDWLT